MEAASGPPETTTSNPGASSRERTAARSLRLIRLRVTAGPADLLTAKPIRGGPASPRSRAAALTPLRRERLPSPWTRRKSELRHSAAGFTPAIDYAEMRARPLARRFFRIARPARVFIRARKPCLRLRRRVLGWKVRLVTEPSSTDPTPQPRHQCFPHREFFGRSGGRASIADKRVSPSGHTGLASWATDSEFPLDARERRLTTMTPGLDPRASPPGGCGYFPRHPALIQVRLARRQYSTAVEKPVERHDIPAQTHFSSGTGTARRRCDLDRWDATPVRACG